MNKRVEREIHVQSLLFFLNRFLGQPSRTYPMSACTSQRPIFVQTLGKGGVRKQTIRRKHHTRNKKYLDIHYALFVVQKSGSKQVYIYPNI